MTKTSSDFAIEPHGEALCGVAAFAHMRTSVSQASSALSSPRPQDAALPCAAYHSALGAPSICQRRRLISGQQVSRFVRPRRARRGEAYSVSASSMSMIVILVGVSSSIRRLGVSNPAGTSTCQHQHHHIRTPAPQHPSTSTGYVPPAPEPATSA